MKNITLTIDDQTLEKVRVLAAQRRTSVNALVRDYLGSLVAKETRTDEARERLLRLVDERNGDLGKRTISREATYDR